MKGQEDMQARASGLEGTCKRGAEPSPLVTEGETEAEGQKSGFQVSLLAKDGAGTPPAFKILKP